MSTDAITALRELMEAWQAYEAAFPTRLSSPLGRLKRAEDQARAVLEAGEKPSFQGRVAPWMQACFGAEISADRLERNDRFIEEAVELAQASGYSKERCLQLVDYVYGRPQGDINQEVGGVMITLAAHCLAHGVDMHEAAETELARIWTKVEQIREKQKTKPKGSALPVPAAAANMRAVVEALGFEPDNHHNALDCPSLVQAARAVLDHAIQQGDGQWRIGGDAGILLGNLQDALDLQSALTAAEGQSRRPYDPEPWPEIDGSLPLHAGKGLLPEAQSPIDWRTEADKWRALCAEMAEALGGLITLTRATLGPTPVQFDCPLARYQAALDAEGK